MLYACDRVSGNVWRIDPKDPKLVVVGRVPEREIGGKKVRANVSGIVVQSAGDLYLTAGGFNEVLRIRGRNLDPRRTRHGANFRHRNRRRQRHRLRQERQSLRHRRSKRTHLPHRTGRRQCRGFCADPAAHAGFFPMANLSRHLPANGIVFDKQGTTLYIADTARGADLETRHRHRRPEPDSPRL